MNKSLTMLPICMATLIAIGGCLRFKMNDPPVSNTPPSMSNQITPMPANVTESKPEPESKGEVTIRPINIYGWWWSDQQLQNNFDADKPPPKEAYVKLDKWDASQPDSPHPDRIDIMCRVENRTKEPIYISLEAFADFKVASYKAIAYGAGTDQAVNEKLKQTQWSDKQEIGVPVSHILLAGEEKDFEFKNFDIRAVIDKFLKPASGDLWPWRLRISMTAKNSKGANVARAEEIISLVPGG